MRSAERSNATSSDVTRRSAGQSGRIGATSPTNSAKHARFEWVRGSIFAPKESPINGHGADFASAEDAVQEALLEATVRWPQTGTPAEPTAWLTTVARGKAEQ